MMLLGFLKKYHSYVDEARVITKSMQFGDEELYQKVVSYLNGGTILLSYMEMIADEKGNTIGPLLIKTDGYWIWPS
jgi:hypothetical protein